MKDRKNKANDLGKLLLEGPTEPEAERELERKGVNRVSFLTGVAVGCVLALVAFILMVEFLR
jgi:hypothetical protein